MGLKRAILLRTRIVFVFGALCALGVFIKLIYLQYAQSDAWYRVPMERLQRQRPLEAHRGSIYASDGSLLATSVPFYRLAIDATLPSDALLNAQLPSFCQRLASFFREYKAGDYQERIEKARTQKERYLLLSKKTFNHSDKAVLSSWPLVKEGRLTGGVLFEKIERRLTPYQGLAARTIGHVDDKQRGLVGLEYSFDAELGGVDGHVIVERAAGGHWYPVYEGSEVYPKHGYDIETTLDVDVQDVVQHALLRVLRRHAADYGLVIVMDVQSSEIRALANLARKSKDVYVADYNYAVGSQGAVEPGSTFKLATFLALSERTPMQLSDSVDTGDGNYAVYTEMLRDTRPGGSGKLSVADAFVESSNIAVAKLVLKHFATRPKVFIDYLRGLALHLPMGFQLKGEGKPFLKTPNDDTWSGTSLAWMAHGYELSLSPLQLLALYNAVANQGVLKCPLLVRSVRDDKKVVRQFSARIINKQIASRRTLRQMQALLRSVVQRGTGKYLRHAVCTIAGKTGTTKKYDNGKYTQGYRASFVGYFPADKPKYSCIVIVDNPRIGGYYGGEVAAPVFKAIVEAIHKTGQTILTSTRNANLPLIQGGMYSDLSQLCKALNVPFETQNKAIWVKTRHLGDKVGWVNAQKSSKTIPNVVGMTLRDALFLLENKQINVIARGKGIRIKHQNPKDGQPVKVGLKVVLTF